MQWSLPTSIDVLELAKRSTFVLEAGGAAGSGGVRGHFERLSTLEE